MTFRSRSAGCKLWQTSRWKSLPKRQWVLLALTEPARRRWSTASAASIGHHAAGSNWAASVSMGRLHIRSWPKELYERSRRWNTFQVSASWISCWEEDISDFERGVFALPLAPPHVVA